jgi:preprotein translocase subunit SecE
MASSKTAIANSEERPAPSKRQEPNAVQNFSGNAANSWRNFTHFLSDVRSEMRKVVTPSRKEVESTTSVVLIAVFLFGLFFFVVDFIFNKALHQVLVSLGGAQ